MENSTEQKKVYCGTGIKKSDTWLKITIHTDELTNYIREYNGKKLITLNVNIGEMDKYGKNVKLTIDQWQPNQEK